MEQTATIGGIIQRLGGPAELARRLGLRPTAVDNWRARDRIPPPYYFAIAEELAAEPPRHLFGFYKRPKRRRSQKGN